MIQRKVTTSIRLWLLLCLFGGIALLWPGPAAKAGDGPPAVAAAPADEAQVFGDDLDVEAGTVLTEDVIVYSGDVRVREDGVIRGDLVVYSGDIDVEEGGLVEGDILTFSGDVSLSGRVTGDIASWSGDVRLDSTAWVGGDISLLSGDLRKDDAAQIAGSVAHGPNFDFAFGKFPFGFTQKDSAVSPDSPTTPDDAEAAVVAAEAERAQAEAYAQSHSSGRGGFFGAVGRSIGRFFGMIMLALVSGAAVAFMKAVKPDWADEVERSVQQETAMSLVTGVAANVGLPLLGLILVITICLWPIPFLALLLINLVGWTGIGQMAGRKLSRRFNLSLQPPATAGLGMAGIFVVAAPFWALGGCFQGIVWLVLSVLGAIGSGAFALLWIRRWQNGEVQFSRHNDGSPGPGGATAPSSAPSEAESGPPTPPSEVTPVVRDIPPVQPSEAVVQEIGEIKVGGVDEPAVEEPTIEITFEAGPPPADDLTAIADIGPVFEQRLKAAGIRTYADLAAAAPEQLADLLGWTPEQVTLSGMREQARALIS